MPVPLRRAGESANVMAKITIDGNTREVADGSFRDISIAMRT